jgi:protein TonB
MLVELLLLLVLLGLTPHFGPKPERKSLTVLTITPTPEAQPKTEPVVRQPDHPVKQPSHSQPPAPVTMPTVTAPAPPIVPTPQPTPVPTPPPTPTPAAPAAPRQVYGPPAPGPDPNDSEIVGTAPNGEPLYAAAWFREPYPEELSGYLSTARGPGWALIACRTAPEWRVEGCVGLGESPEGSNIERSVLAAAWQFKVRPPRYKGRSLVGSWVRIRITYSERPPGGLGPSRR